MRIMRATGRDDRGAAAVEFALVLPMLMLLVLGIVQFGLIFTQWLEMEHAAREGARWGSLGYDSTAIVSKVEAAAPALQSANMTITVTPTRPADFPGDPVTVTIYYKTPVLPLIGPLLGQRGPTMQLEATAIHRIE